MRGAVDALAPPPDGDADGGGGGGGGHGGKRGKKRKVQDDDESVQRGPASALLVTRVLQNQTQISRLGAARARQCAPSHSWLWLQFIFVNTHSGRVGPFGPASALLQSPLLTAAAYFISTKI